MVCRPAVGISRADSRPSKLTERRNKPSPAASSCPSRWVGEAVAKPTPRLHKPLPYPVVLGRKPHDRDMAASCLPEIAARLRSGHSGARGAGSSVRLMPRRHCALHTLRLLKLRANRPLVVARAKATESAASPSLTQRVFDEVQRRGSSGNEAGGAGEWRLPRGQNLRRGEISGSPSESQMSSSIPIGVQAPKEHLATLLPSVAVWVEINVWRSNLPA